MDYNITYREKDKGWQYIVSYKDSGKWRQKSKQGFASKKDAKKAANKRLEELKEDWALKGHAAKEYDGITFGDFSTMFIDRQRIYREHNTVANCLTAVKNFNSLHDIPLEHIQHKDVQANIDFLAKKGLSAEAVKLYTQKISFMLDSAVNPYMIIPRNPISLKTLSLPKSNDKNKIKALNKAETEKLLDKMKRCQSDDAYSYYMLTLVLLTTGARIGEAIGLTWTDLDFVSGAININKQWKKIKGGQHGLGALKSKNSNRVVPVPPRTFSELKKYKETSITDIHNRIFIYNATNTASGGLSHAFKKVGFNITAHDLRHTYATALIGNGIDFKTVAKLLGHSVQMTMNTYSHVTDDMMEKAKSTINIIF